MDKMDQKRNETETLTGSDSPPREGNLTKIVEHETSKVPSIGFLGLAFFSVGLSLLMKAQGKNTAANFIGLWVPTFLLLGIYNKIVKVHGSDLYEH